MTYSEADTRAKLIEPAIRQRGWDEDSIRREVTDGSIEIIDGRPRRTQKRMDFLLRFRVNQGDQPVAFAVIEAKREDMPPGHGLEQAKLYGQCDRFNVGFVFSSNGHLFVEFDRCTGITSSPRPLSEFPTPKDLQERYEESRGFSLDSEEARPLLQTYPEGEGRRRYYQDAAIRAVLEKLAKCATEGKPKRAMLSMATGCGKTFLVVNLLKRIAEAGLMRRALFVCDRDELRAQASREFRAIFGSDAADVFRRPDGTNNARNARVHIATYQMLGVESAGDKGDRLREFYQENEFSHVIIDECHRSAWGCWSQVLLCNKDAAHIGITATPRKLATSEKTKEVHEDIRISANNYEYFGDPVYEYDMLRAIEDGYLARCEVQRCNINLDEAGVTKEEIMGKHPTSPITGESIGEEEIDAAYQKNQYEAVIVLPDRVREMSKSLFDFLVRSGGPHQKTIIFCVNDMHAESVAAEINNLYVGWCQSTHTEMVDWYAFKCTAAANGGGHIPDFRGSRHGHFVATTVDLLSTGIDIPCVQNIVFFRYIGSPIVFYQMIGRGTRIDQITDKLSFCVYDYTNATRLFGEEDYIVRSPRSGGGKKPETARQTIQVEGFEVVVADAGKLILVDENGEQRLIPVEEYRARLGKQLVEITKSINDFRAVWVNPSERERLLETLARSGYPVAVVWHGNEEYDLYDVLGEIGWGLTPRTREDRVVNFSGKHAQWLGALPPATCSTILAILKQFEKGGVEVFENTDLFEVPSVASVGGLDALGTTGNPQVLLRKTKDLMFAA